MAETWSPVFEYDGQQCRALALEPVQNKLTQPVDYTITDETGTWKLIRLDEFRGAHPDDRNAARGEWYTRRVTYALQEDPDA